MLLFSSNRGITIRLHLLLTLFLHEALIWKSKVGFNWSKLPRRSFWSLNVWYWFRQAWNYVVGVANTIGSLKPVYFNLLSFFKNNTWICHYYITKSNKKVKSSYSTKAPTHSTYAPHEKLNWTLHHTQLWTLLTYIKQILKYLR